MTAVAVVVVSGAKDSDARSIERLELVLASIARQTAAVPASIALVHEADGAQAAAHAVCDSKAVVEIVPAGQGGLSAAVNAAVAKSAAPLIALADGETVWAPRKLAAQSAAFARPGVDLCGHREAIDRDGIPHVVAEFPGESKWPPLLQALRRPLWRLGTTMLRRAAFDKLGGLHDGPEAGQDFLIRALRADLHTFRLEAPLAEVAADPGDWPAAGPAPKPEAFAAIRAHLDELSPEQIIGRPPADVHAARLVRGGLFHLYGFLDGCHEAAQAVEEPTSNFWHALMHRAEGDFDNSKYWWRRAGAHPVFADLYREATAMLKSAVGRDAAELRGKLDKAGEWDAFAFVDFCRGCAGGRAGKTAIDLAARIAALEFRLLFAHTAAAAIGGAGRL